MCTKIKHDTTYHAARHILALKIAGKMKQKKRMGIYPCEECGKYHITSSISRKCIVITK